VPVLVFDLVTMDSIKDLNGIIVESDDVNGGDGNN
jgi:hypothetical protein